MTIEPPPGSSGEGAAEPLLFYPNRQLLQPESRAPVLLNENSKRAFRGILRQLLSLHEVHAALVEPATVIGSSALFGSQEIVLGCHDLLLSSQPEALKRACARIVTACREFTGSLEGIYALRQSSDDLRDSSPGEADAASDPALGCSRLKDLASRLEDFFASASFPVRMDLERLATLQVHLDEVYDHSTRILESFYSALVLSPARAPLARFCEQCYTEVTGRIVPGHIVDEKRQDASSGNGESPPSSGDSRSTSLMELLPELSESV